jgi:hypothetical protein
MDTKQTAVALALMGVVVLIWAVAPLIAPRQYPSLSLSQAPLLFDGSQAQTRVAEFVTRFPNRVLGSLEARQSTGYLQQYFTTLGYEVGYTHFDSIIASRTQVGRNVLASKSGRVPRIIAVIAHYDTAPTTVQGAMDNGSGVGVLLELARVFSQSRHRHSLLFVGSDGEEWGMLGALDLAANHPDRERIAAVVSLDYVAVGDLARLELATVGQHSGYSPRWLRDLAGRAIRAENLRLAEPAGFEEHLERALLISWTDQGPFLARGIPAINLGSRSTDLSREREAYHSPGDTIDNMRTASLASYGRAAERLLRTLDDLDPIPTHSDGHFRLNQNVSLSAGTMTYLHILTLVPFVAILAFYTANHGRYLTAPLLRRESLAFVATALPFIAVYYLIGLFRGLRMLPRYSLYPATAKDPVLENPNWGIVGGIAALVVGVGVIAWLVVRFVNRNLPRPSFGASKVFLLWLFLAVLILSFQYNPYWAVSFLALPAWIWALSGRGKSPGLQAAGAVAIIAAGVVYYLVTGMYAARLGLGWKIIWYELLALNTGMFSLAAFLLAAAVFALGIRFLVIQFRQGEGS